MKRRGVACISRDSFFRAPLPLFCCFSTEPSQERFVEAVEPSLGRGNEVPSQRRTVWQCHPETETYPLLQPMRETLLLSSGELPYLPGVLGRTKLKTQLALFLQVGSLAGRFYIQELPASCSGSGENR